MFHATPINFLHVWGLRCYFSEEKQVEKAAAVLCNMLVNAALQRLCWAAGFCSLTAKALELLISLLFASDSKSEAINSKRQKKEVGKQVWRGMPKGREGKKGISSRVVR